jgi:anti-sigma B factor antagonist
MEAFDQDGSLISVEELQVGRRIVLAVAGEVDLSSVDELKAALERAHDEHPAELWLDLTGVDFIDSTGLTAILLAHRQLDDGVRRLAVICPGGSVRRVLELAGLDRAVPVYETRAAAQAAS